MIHNTFLRFLKFNLCSEIGHAFSGPAFSSPAFSGRAFSYPENLVPRSLVLHFQSILHKPQPKPKTIDELEVA